MKRNLLLIIRYLGKKLAIFFLVFIGLIALFSPVLVNENPLMVIVNGKHFFPIFSDEKPNGMEIDWSMVESKQGLLKVERVIWPLIRFVPGKPDLKVESYSPPITSNGQSTHWLGTGKTGEDVLAGLVAGTRISLQIGIFSMLLSAVIGLILGLMSGFYAHRILSFPLIGILIFCLFMFASYYWIFDLWLFLLSDSEGTNGILVLFALLLFIGLNTLTIGILKKYRQKLTVSWLPELRMSPDALISRLTELFVSLPKLIILLSMLIIFKPSVYTLILIFGFTSWVQIARIVRAEVLSLVQSDFIASCRVLHMSDFKIIVKHVFPNILLPVTVSFVFGISELVLAESSLSFLGLGVPQEVITWGKILASGRESMQAWWLVFFPGLSLFLFVLALNQFARTIQRKRSGAMDKL